MIPSSAAVARAGELLRRRIGLRVEASLYLRLARAVGDAARQAGQDPEEFVAGLNDETGSLQSLCDLVTVQESGFFRHPEHFDVLARRLLPAVSGPVRIWSAACGYGQEPYSLAMVLAEQGVEGRILATDVSRDAERRTRQALYSDRELGGLSEWRRHAHGTMTESTWAVAPALRSRVDVAVHNLLDPLPPEVALCQIVFCRNVLIYFTAEHAAAFVDRLADALPPDAHLFLGGAESMLSVSDRFEPRHLDDTFVYRVRRPAARVQRASSASPPRTRPSRPRHAGRSPATAKPVKRSEPERPTRRVRPSEVPSITTAELARLGREAHARGDHAEAVRLFRKWAYLDRDDPLAHFHLGLALEGAGDRAAALRSFGVSRSLLLRGDVSESVEAFGGFSIDDVLQMIATKQEAGR
jgi:chemotaxis methyl-accepting protein methylase